jgi:hypothetical protein
MSSPFGSREQQAPCGGTDDPSVGEHRPAAHERAYDARGQGPADEGAVAVAVIQVVHRQLVRDCQVDEYEVSIRAGLDAPLAAQPEPTGDVA